MISVLFFGIDILLLTELQQKKRVMDSFSSFPICVEFKGSYA